MREKHGVHFGLISMVNHWFVAFTFIGVLSLGFYLEFVGDGRGPGGPMMGVHKAAGVLVLVLASWRLLWRLYNGFPEETIEMPTWQVLSAKLVHWMLLFATIAMPVSGILMSIYGDRAINVFGLFVIPTLPENEWINRVSDTFHWGLAYAVAGAICMHVGAVLKHHFIDRDDTLARMTKRVKPKTKTLRARRPRPDGERPRRPRPDGERPRRPRPDGERPRRPRPDGERPRRPRPDGERPRRPRPDGERPRRPRPKPKKWWHFFS